MYCIVQHTDKQQKNTRHPDKMAKRRGLDDPISTDILKMPLCDAIRQSLSWEK